VRGVGAETRAAARPVLHAIRNEAETQQWRDAVRRETVDALNDFVSARCAEVLAGCGVDIAADVLSQYLGGGKCLRSTFMYLGWCCGAEPDGSAVRASASLEFLQAFALLQDDVMDVSAFRRGRPSAHAQFESWHRDHGLPGSAKRFGESAAVLLGDMCLVWAEEMLRSSGVKSAALDRVWPRYDEMRTELAAGQLADLVNVTRRQPTLEQALDIAARKSGNYTVRRPLEIGAAMAGCDERSLWLLGRYGSSVGEAFQLRDDLLDVFGSATVMGKPAGGDLREHKATSVVVAAHQHADASTRRQLTELMNADRLDEADIERWRTMIVATGAVEWIEELITERTGTGLPAACRRVSAGDAGQHGDRLHGACSMTARRTGPVG
jgi:geranylgeranyl diphosphate synthase, type I